MLKKKAAQLRLDTLTAVYKAGLGNVGSIMSSVEIMVALYYEILQQQDYLILSRKGALPLQYAILADLGLFDKSELSYLGQPGALLKTDFDMKVPGIFANLVADGQGLSVALGIALSLKQERLQNRVFAVLGDHELMKGEIWEAALCAAHYNLDNLVAVIDDPLLDIDCGVKVDRVQDKFEAFGWHVIHVIDGHNFDELLTAFDKASKAIRKPVCIWCHTISGKGIEFAERKASYLHATLSEGEMSEIIPKLQQLA